MRMDRGCGLIALGCAALLASPSLAASPTKESCGWQVEIDGRLVERPDPRLRLLDGKAPIPTPPEGAKAAYCIRDTIMPGEHDYKTLMMGLPLYIIENEAFFSRRTEPGPGRGDDAPAARPPGQAAPA